MKNNGTKPWTIVTMLCATATTWEINSQQPRVNADLRGD